MHGEKMRAASYSRYGPPEVIELTEIEKPLVKDDELLIKVHATTVNRTDCGFRSAQYFISRFFSGLFRPKNKILGNEFAGEIEAIGNRVSCFKTGEKVFGYNDLKFGAHAEYMTIKETDALATIPNGLTYEEATPLMEGSHYALGAIRAAKVKSGQHVLVYGATGSIGTAAVQLLKHFGANITAVCNTKNVALVKALGADIVIDYTKQDFTSTGETYDFILDAVGKSSFGQCKPLLEKRGIYISTELGKNSENIFLALITPLSKGRRLLFPLPSISKKDVEFLKTLVVNKEYKPVIDRKYRFDEIVEAYRYVETGQKTGSVIIKVVDE